MLGLGIESSCDETSVAVVGQGQECLSNIIFSQIEEHAPFRGVVPEIASRSHLEKINFAYEKALKTAGVSLEQIDYIAVAVQPGLVGSLLIGASLAKCLALVTGLPVVRTDHVEAHLYASCLEGWQPQYPFLGLLLSGGNSAIYRVEGPDKLSTLADTLDDACGEAFDKAASMLRLGYPGGPAIEKQAVEYRKRQMQAANWQQKNGAEPNKPVFGPLLKNLPQEKIAFSFSGIKTAVRQACKQGLQTSRICHDFQDTIFELVERNLIKACKQSGIKHVVAGGGVLANDSLRKRLRALARREAMELTYPQRKSYCTDNAAMIAAAGYYLRHSIRETRALDFEVSSHNRNVSLN